MTTYLFHPRWELTGTLSAAKTLAKWLACVHDAEVRIYFDCAYERSNRVRFVLSTGTIPTGPLFQWFGKVLPEPHKRRRKELIERDAPAPRLLDLPAPAPLRDRRAEFAAAYGGNVQRMPQGTGFTFPSEMFELHGSTFTDRVRFRIRTADALRAANAVTHNWYA